MDFEKDKNWLWMTHVKEMWRGKARKVLNSFDSPEELYMAKQQELEKTGIFTDADIYNIMAAKQMDMENVWHNLS